MKHESRTTCMSHNLELQNPPHHLYDCLCTLGKDPIQSQKYVSLKGLNCEHLQVYPPWQKFKSVGGMDKEKRINQKN